MSDLKQANELKRALQRGTQTLDSTSAETALDLVADLEAVISGAPADPFFTHNVAALINSMADRRSTAELTQLGPAAIPCLIEGMSADPDDLAVPLALASVLNANNCSDDTLSRLVQACDRPHAGVRLVAEVAGAFSECAHGGGREAEQLLVKLDSIIAQAPGNEAALVARLRLLLKKACGSDGAQRTKALGRFDALVSDVEATIGSPVELQRLKLEASTIQLATGKFAESARIATQATALIGDLWREHVLTDTDVISLVQALAENALLNGDIAHQLLAPAQDLSQQPGAAPDMHLALSQIVQATGDTDAVIDLHTEQVRNGEAGEAARIALSRVLVDHVAKGEGSPLAMDVETWVVKAFPAEVARSIPSNVAISLLEHVAHNSGAADAAAFVEKSLLSVHKLARSPELLVRAVQLLADSGAPEQALALGHSRLSAADSAELRLTLAKIHIGAGIRVAEAEVVLRKLSASNHRAATEAKSLRETILAHPDFAAEQRRGMLDIEKRLGVGSGRATHGRVLYPSDRYALAELPDVRAPGFYPHRHLRVMVHDKNLPEGLSISDLRKGFEFTGHVIGKDDLKGDRIRVYWIEDNTVITPLGAPPASTGKDKKSAAKDIPLPTEDEEKKFNIGTEQEALIKVEKVLLRKGLVLGKVLDPSGDGPKFPTTVGLHRKFFGDLDLKTLKRNTRLTCKIERSEQGDKRRYEATSDVTILPRQTDPPADKAEDQPAEETTPEETGASA